MSRLLCLTCQTCLTCLTFLGSGFCREGWAAEDAPPAPGAPFLTCQEQVMDFGMVQDLGELSHLFTLMNAGEAPAEVTITKPDTSKCKCRPATVYSTNIAWGCELDVPVTHPLRGRKGPLEYVVSVTGNDPSNPEVLLTMKADIQPLIDVIPEMIDFRKMPLSEVITNTCKLKIMPGAKVKIRRVKTGSEYISARLWPSSEADTFEVRVTTCPPLPPGPLDDVITVTTDNRDVPELTIPVRLDAVGPIEGLPAAIPLLRHQPSQTQTAYARSKYVDFYITAITFPAPGMGARIADIDKNTYRITITNMNPTAISEGDGIEINTSYPLQPELFIPVELVDH
ncbi:MAG: DUF1573 domain-containing protein [Spartobacteria bacterium]|nr:DUF1573 domain-containing protein [Spartobacteria bacterium]